MSQTSLLETERLTLEPWDSEHAELLVRLSAMPEVTRFVASGEVWPRARALEWSSRAGAHWERHGFGWRAAIERASGDAVGFVALNVLGEGVAGVSPDEREIGWWLDPAYSGRGYATEGAQAVYDDALGRLRCESVVARIQPANAASRRVAERLGMRLELETTGLYGEPVVVHRGP